MGAGASAAATLVVDAECQRPLDASDLATLDASGARDEVARLRGLLAAHADLIRRAVSEHQQQLQSDTPTSTQQLTREYQDSGQQTDECVDRVRPSSDPEATAVMYEHDTTLCTDRSCSALALVPGIQEYLITCFANADLDSSGVLSAYEFSRLLREHSELGLSPEDIQLLLAQANWMDAKGDVTWQQFVQLAPQLLANLADASSPSGASDWCACITAEGTPYYYNKRTQESVWDKPEQLELELQQGSLPPRQGQPQGQPQERQQQQQQQQQLATARTDTIRVRPRSG